MARARATPIPGARGARRLLLVAAALLAGSAVGPGDATSVASGAPDEPAANADLVRDLAQAIDRESPKGRAASAGILAARGDVALPAWIAAAKALAPRGAVPEPGRKTEDVDLPVLDRMERTSLEVHVPKGYAPGTPAPLILAFHGAGGRGGDALADWAGVAESIGALVVAPTEAGPNDGYRFSPRERAAALEALRWARRRFDVDEDRIAFVGTSRGGHLTWDLGLRHPDLAAALVPVIGAPRVTNLRNENNLRFLENVVDVSIRDLQGEKDDARAVGNVKLAFERLGAWKARDAKLLLDPERGHDADLAVVDWVAFLGGVRREPGGDHVVLRATGPARARWVEILAVDGTVGEEVAPPQPPSWDRMDDLAKRRFIADAADLRTARLEATRSAPGRFDVKSRGVARFRLLLAEGTFDPAQPVQVVWNGRPVVKRVPLSKSVLLGDFVERFDRRFLPVAELRVP